MPINMCVPHLMNRKKHMILNITTRKVFHTESGLPEEVLFINHSVSIRMKQVNVMGHNKCSRKCLSASPFTVLEVEENIWPFDITTGKCRYNVLRNWS